MTQQPGPWGQPQGQQNYQQGPPQGWAPQQNPAYGNPPAQFQGANPGAGQMPIGAPEAFKSAAPSTAGGENPRIGQMNGRLILFRPTNYNPMAKGFGSNPPGPQITTEAIVLDGPPVEGILDGKTGQVTPFTTGPRQTPFYVSAFYLTQQGLIQQLESAVPGREFCLNRVEIKSIGQGKTWYRLIDMTPEDEQLARSIIGNGSIQAGWDQIKRDTLARYMPAEGQQAPAPAPQNDPWGQAAQQVAQGQQNPAWGSPPAQQGPPAGWGQPAAPQGPPPGWGQQPAQGPPAGWGGQQ